MGSELVDPNNCHEFGNHITMFFFLNIWSINFINIDLIYQSIHKSKQHKTIQSREMINDTKTKSEVWIATSNRNVSRRPPHCADTQLVYIYIYIYILNYLCFLPCQYIYVLNNFKHIYIYIYIIYLYVRGISLESRKKKLFVLPISSNHKVPSCY